MDNHVGIDCGSGVWDGWKKTKKEKLRQFLYNNNN